MHTKILVLWVSCAALAGCGSSADGAGSASAGASGAAGAAAAGAKTCPDSAPFCFTLPAGFTVKNPQSGGWGGSVDIADGDKKKTATMIWAKPETYNGRVLQTEANYKLGEDQKTEKLLDGKGVYFEHKKDDVHWFEAIVKGDSNAWQCTGRQPKADPGTELASLCKSMTPK